MIRLILAALVLICVACAALAQSPSPPPGYQGCYTDLAAPKRGLPRELMTSGATVTSCIAAAKAAGFSYAGTQYFGECWAGNTLGITKSADSNCNAPCTADSTQTCGGTWFNSIYATIPPPPPGNCPAGQFVISVTPFACAPGIAGPAGAAGAPGSAGTPGAAGPAGPSFVPAQAFGTPTSAKMPCVQGSSLFDANFVYLCVATNSWQRFPNGAAW